MKKFGLTGGRLGHSLSGPIHKKLFELKGVKADYGYYETDKLEECFDKELSGLSGFNVTIPYKKDIIGLIDYPHENVLLYNACNTVVKKEDGFYGFNTDVDGFLYTLESRGTSLSGSRVLITGAGGVSHMLACESARRGAEVFLHTRSEEKGRRLSEFVKEKTGKEIKLYNGEKNIDILLQGTPAGMFPDYFDSAVSLELAKDISFVFDMIYNPEKTLIMNAVELFGGKSASGLSMLVCQAAKAQERYLDVSFTDEEIKRVEDEMSEYLNPIKPDFNIILIGMPGCGKTTVGKAVAKLFNGSFRDVDEEVEKRENKRITEIFAENGEAFFRARERETFLSILKEGGNVISTGGGLAVHNNIKELKGEKDVIVYMDTPLEILAGRLKNDISRPLLSGNAVEKLAALEKERKEIYKRTADICVEACGGIEEYAVKLSWEIVKFVKGRLK